MGLERGPLPLLLGLLRWLLDQERFDESLLNRGSTWIFRLWGKIEAGESRMVALAGEGWNSLSCELGAWVRLAA